MNIEIQDTTKTTPIRSIPVGDCFIFGRPEKEEVFPLFMRTLAPIGVHDQSGYWAVRLADGQVAQYGHETQVVPFAVKVVPA